MTDDTREDDTREDDTREDDTREDDTREDDTREDDTREDAPSTRPRPALRPAARHRAAAVIGILTLCLGFAIAVQVHANSKSDSLSYLREDDLIGILDNQDSRAERLRQQIAEIEASLQRLQDSGDQSAAARQQAEQEQQTLGILLGTVAATGPGVRVTITDPQSKIAAEDLLDVVEELRGAGAEAIEFGGVRIGPTSAFTTVDGAPAVDGQRLTRPYVVLAIGEPGTLDTALNIPGGVAATIRTLGGQVQVQQRSRIDVTATRALPPSNYLTPHR